MSSRPDLMPTTFETSLAKFVEEAGEALQMVGKIGRHGLHAVDPKTGVEYDNGADLVRELCDVVVAATLVVSLHPDSPPGYQSPGLFNDVGRFHEKFGLARAGDAAPGFLDHDTLDFRVKFMQEELQEFVVDHMAGDLAGAADALVDLVYVALGTAHMMRVPFDECWDEVQRANMAKERASGADDARSTRRHTLDVVKPAGWKAPDHGPILRRARERAELDAVLNGPEPDVEVLSDGSCRPASVVTSSKDVLHEDGSCKEISRKIC